jgi:exonuclease III
MAQMHSISVNNSGVLSAMRQSNAVVELNIVTFNMHGYNQGKPVLDELCCSGETDIVFLQEHWLTPANLQKLAVWDKYQFFGCSAMSDAVAAGPLKGRPYGGVGFLVKNSHLACTKVIHTSERIIALTLGDCLLVCVYLPCAGTVNRALLYADLLVELSCIRDNFACHVCVIGGDLNVDLQCNDAASVQMQDFMRQNDIKSCFDVFPTQKLPTYINEAFGHKSTLDYFLSSDCERIRSCAVLEPSVNFSDHVPLACTICVGALTGVDCAAKCQAKVEQFVPSLRWDHANLSGYYDSTRAALAPVESRVSRYYDALLKGSVASDADAICAFVDSVLQDTASVLHLSASFFVPCVKKGALKHWWDSELDDLKQAAIVSHRVWVATGRPRQGPIFDKKQQARLRYRAQIKCKQQAVQNVYTNDLHECLSSKDPTRFWKAWRAKFESFNPSPIINGSQDPAVVCDAFEKYFKGLAVMQVSTRAQAIHTEYVTRRTDYVGRFCNSLSSFNVDIVSSCLGSFKRGKASGLDHVTSEHLQFSHPVVVLILCKLFNMLLHCGKVPLSFRTSYIVPIPKVTGTGGKPLECDDFRGISINATFSKLFEKCLLVTFDEYLTTNENQFGFKAGIGCSHAIYAAKSIIDAYCSGGYTANVCALDITKAFPSLNHDSLFNTLMERDVPICLLQLLEFWYNNSYSCIKWVNLYSELFQLSLGVLQGSCLAPALFGICIDKVISRCHFYRYGFILVYADDILLISNSVSNLQKLLSITDLELSLLDLKLNVKKSCCIRIGPRFDRCCANLVIADGSVINWCSELRYLGVFLLAGANFKSSFDNAKRAFNRSVNCILSRVGTKCSEVVLAQLIRSKCVPILIYGSEACGLNKSAINSLDFTFVRFMCKIFKTSNRQVILDCLDYCALELPSVQIQKRFQKFMNKFSVVENSFCQFVSWLSSSASAGTRVYSSLSGNL